METSPASARRLAAACLLLALAASCARRERTESPPRPSRDLLAEARSIVEAMPVDALAGQVLMVGVTGSGSLPEWNREFLSAVKPGGVVLFGFNVPEDPARLAPFLEEAASAASTLRPFFAIDHEGGPVFRFKRGLTRLPAARDLGRAGEGAAVAAGSIAGAELRALGISMDLAPVTEALDRRNESFLGLRAWSGDPAAAGSLARAFLEACQGAGAAGVLKHFPGNASVDPHYGLATLDADLAELESIHLEAFRLALEGEPAAVMLSHVLAPAIDPERPVTLSPAAIGLLKGRLGFGGIALTDDLLMKGLGGEPKAEANAVAALAAGADMLMLSGGAVIARVRDAIVAAVADGSLPRERLLDAASRVVAQKLRFGLLDETRADRDARLAGLPALLERDRELLARALAAGEPPPSPNGD